MAAPFWPAASVMSRTDTPRPLRRKSCSAVSSSRVLVATAIGCTLTTSRDRVETLFESQGGQHEMPDRRFAGRVAIVPGGGRGLGRAYSRHLAARGCQVLVNDPGVATHGVPTDETAADDAVAEVTSDGGA